VSGAGTRTGAQIVWDVLAREGVEVVFGYPGGAIMPVYDAMVAPDQKVRHVLVRHEQGAAHMADGYARASGKVGVALATSGPGATNLVTGIATAMLDSSPIVCITGQVASALLGSDAFQETDITGVTIPITKHNYLVTRACDVGPTLREAFEVARSGRPGPVLVDITKDAQQASAPFTWEAWAPQMRTVPTRSLRLPEPDEALARAVAMIDAAERPLILAGQGVVHAQATEALVALAEKTGIPVASTLLGLGGFPASHPLALGMMGMHGEAWVNAAIQRADLLIAIGMRFDDRVTGNLRTYAVHAKKIHVEIDPAEINKNVKVDVPLLLDARTATAALASRVVSRLRPVWLDSIHDAKREASARDIQRQPAEGKLRAAHVMSDLCALASRDAIVVTDVGQHQMWEAQYWRHESPRSLVTSGGLGTMGFALPAAIGARFAHPEREIWVVAGDGGFQMTACELSTIAQEKIKLHIAIINNGYLGMVRQWQELFYGGRYAATPIKSPDFVKLAEAHDLRGIRVSRREDIRRAVEEARSIEGTVIFDFRVEAEECVYPMVPAGADLQDMIRRPTPPESRVQEPQFEMEE
jgi:acetolactate synthase-1/2/3 large subunit